MLKKEQRETKLENQEDRQDMCLDTISSGKQQKTPENSVSPSLTPSLTP